MAVLEIKVPPLSERGRDILQISNYYIKKFSKETGREIRELGEEEYRQLSSYNWPGNIRELKNYIERAVIFSKDGCAHLPPLPKLKPETSSGKSGFNYRDFIREKEREFLKNALVKCGGNIEKTARLIHMSVPFVYKKIREYGISQD
jgi:DNA-binding NtrC family response regulator